MARTKTKTRTSASATKLTNGALTAPRAELQPRVRVTINKAYKMYVGGAFIRSESGRYFQVKSAAMVPNADPDVVNVPRGSRKDVRDAVLAAKNAGEGWAARTPYNRGQILYRLAEMMESRREELVTALVRGGVSATKAVAEVNASVDRAVFYAGFSDKFHSLLASSNPVAGPHFNFSVPEPMGVIGIVAPPRPSLLGLVSAALPAITGGNTCVVLASEEDPRTALVFAEALATSDLPGGVLNILTGSPGEVGPVLSKHREVIGVEAWTSDAKLRETLERDGADNVKRIKTHELRGLDWSTLQGLGYIERFLETKTVWHPVGL